MKRRDFIQLTALGSAAPLAGLSATSAASNRDKHTRLPAADFALEEKTIVELQEAMAAGIYTSRAICEMYLARIKEIDQVENGINSVIELNPDALAIADALDKERQAGKVRGPLHGIPVLVKDNIDTADKMMTTAGSLALAGNIASRDAFIIERLRAAGAVLLGKTNLSEWANFRSSRSSSGWSSRGRQTRNPYALDRSPCGSSSGSGAAVAANLCAVAIGTETNGSIVCPSSANGIVGIKPTVGLWSRSGIIPISATQDTAGPMARTVADAAALLGPLTGTDPRDERTRESEGMRYSDYTQFLDMNGLQGKRIGVLRSTFGFHEQVDEIMSKALAVMQQAGATLVDPIEIITMQEFGGSGYQVMLYEFKDGLNKYLATANGKVKSLEELIAFNEEHRDEIMPYFQQERLEAAAEKGGLDSQEYQQALKKMLTLSREQGIDAVMAAHKLDAIVAPTGGPAWCIDLINGDHFGGGSSSMAARAGYPNITVPAGYVHGLPVGISMFAGAYQEPRLIAMAYAFEQASKVRQAPAMPATLNLP